jgi:hypothetical protein
MPKKDSPQAHFSQEPIMLGAAKRTLNVRPDPFDARDTLYAPSLLFLPNEAFLDDYQKLDVPILDQGEEGACVGFSLASVVHYLLRRQRKTPDELPVSPHFLYDMAKRFDEWAGENYDGSSIRGGMKAWYKLGAVSEKLWPIGKRNVLGRAQLLDGLKRPLGVYKRVNTKDLLSMQSALIEGGILYCSGRVTSGWAKVNPVTGLIPFETKIRGGHAFVIVGYNETGFWIQNSWGKGWGKDGFALLTYQDALINLDDCWVAHMAVPVQQSVAAGMAATGRIRIPRRATSISELRAHVIATGNNGESRNWGKLGTNEDEIKALFKDDFLTRTKNWEKRRLLLHAHGGLVHEEKALDWTERVKYPFMNADVYPIHTVWKTDYLTTLQCYLNDVLKRYLRFGGPLDEIKNFFKDRIDDAIEPRVRELSGKLVWDEIKQNAFCTTAGYAGKKGALYVAAEEIKKISEKYGENFELHLSNHSAGSILHAPLIQLLATKGKIPSGPMAGKEGFGIKISSLTMLSPAITMSLFKEAYYPLLKNAQIERFSIFTLTDKAEKDDNCLDIYNKSVLYLVSNAFEDKPRIPSIRDGVPILGMEKFIQEDAEIKELFKKKTFNWILAPNTNGQDGSLLKSDAQSHISFDDNETTLRALLCNILSIEKTDVKFPNKKS